MHISEECHSWLHARFKRLYSHQENLLIAFMAWVQMWVWFFKKTFRKRWRSDLGILIVYTRFRNKIMTKQTVCKCT